MPGLPAKSCYQLAPDVPPPTSYIFTCRGCRQRIAVADPQLSQQMHRQVCAAGFDRRLADIHIDIVCNDCAAA